MAVQKRYEAPLQVVHTKEVRDRITAVADKEGISQAQVIREIIDAGLATREMQSAGPCPAVLNVVGEHFACDLTGPHAGLAHSSRGAQAIWAETPTP